jgi:DNA invertase Pin-like site-specific DNA recombinase
MLTDPPGTEPAPAHKPGWILSRLRQMRRKADDRAAVGKLIRELAEHHGYSLNQIAEASGIPRTTVQRWANDTKTSEDNSDD